MKVTIQKKTDQLNYEDFLGGVTRVVTIAGVRAGTKEQQYDIAIEGDKRVWRPAVTVLKLLVEAWGDDAREWVGRRAMLYGDPSIKFGPEKVGGIRVSHLSHIEKPIAVSLTETRGKRKLHKVEPLPDVPVEPSVNPVALAENIAEATTADEVKKIGNFAHSHGVLDAEVDGRPLRDHVTGRLADFAEQERAEAKGGEPA